MLFVFFNKPYNFSAMSGQSQHLLDINQYYLSRVLRKPDFCLCENKGADQLRSNCEAEQRLCFRYMDNTFPLLSKSKI